jgi:hypothetical protein
MLDELQCGGEKFKREKKGKGQKREGEDEALSCMTHGLLLEGNPAISPDTLSNIKE